MSKSYQLFLFLFISIVFSFVQPHSVFAHAILVKAIPAPESKLQSPPAEIVLSFNERLEKELFSIKVLNAKGESVSRSEAQMSEDQRALHLQLPNLPNGIYTISYSILSADGHPVRGSYVVSVGDTNDHHGAALPQYDLHHDHAMTDPVSTSIIRALYYLSLLLVSGWLAWGIMHRMESEPLKGSYRQWSFYLQQAFLIFNLAIGLLEFMEILNGWNPKEIVSLLTRTVAGVSWLISMALSIGGLFFLNRNLWVDGIWVILLLATKSVNGHAMAFDPPMRTVLLDIVHLFAAAVWAGGLFYIVVFWKKHRYQVQHFIPIFSKAALLSILTLIVTGTLSILIYLPKVRYLLYSTWGILLIGKIAAVLIVILVAGILRWKMKKKQEDLIQLIKIDFFLMIAITVIVGIITYLSLVPQNQPLFWHENTKNVEFTTTISPKSPGNNEIMIEASSHQEGLQIKRVELYLKYKDNLAIAPIEVPFEASTPALKVHYMKEGPYLPFSGNWTVEVRILDSEDNESVYAKNFIIF